MSPAPSTDATRLPLAAALAAAVAGGLALWLAFPSTGWWPLAPVGIALLCLAVAGRRPVAAAGLGLVHGLAFMVPLLHWSGIYVGALPWLALSTLQALYLAATAALLPRALRSPAAPLAVAGLWVLQEALRARTPYGGFPWGRLAFSQADAPTAALAALGGAPLVSFAVALAGALLAVGVLHRRRLAGGLSGLAAGALVVAVGLLVPLPTTGRDVRVAGVQGDVPQAGLDFNSQRRAVLDNHAAVTRGLAQQVTDGTTRRPDLVVWPENSSDLDPFVNPDARAVIDRAVDEAGVPVLVGTLLERPAGKLTNASIVWTPGRGPGAMYAKRHPVPFGEYIPDRDFYRRLSPEVDLVRRDFVAGHRVGVLQVGPARAGVAICFEVAYDSLVRDTVRHGADLLVVQTNNATFGRSDEAVQQLAMSRIRAVEHGRAVAHVSTVGVSALIAPDGRVLTSSRLFTPALLQATLPLRTTLTVADRLGGWVEAGLVALGVLLVLVGAGPRRRDRLGPRRTDLAPTGPADLGPGRPATGTQVEVR